MKVKKQSWKHWKFELLFEKIGGKSCWMWSVGEVLLCKVRHLNCNLMMLQPLLAQCAPPGSEHEQTCWTWDILEAVRIFHTSNRSPFHVVPKKVWKLRVISAPVEPSRVSNGTYAFEPLRSSKRCWEIHENPQIFFTMNHRRRHSRNVQKEDNTFSSVDSLLIQFCADMRLDLSSAKVMKPE